MKLSVGFLSGALLLCACTSAEKPISRDLTDFGTRYAAAWSSQNPAQLASFYAENGSLIVNGGPPSRGRTAIAAKAQSFMTAFPDMVVRLERMDQHGDHPVFRWIWTGTNTGPGGTGKFVRITGYEEWTINANGLIAKSSGHYDEAEYERQLKVGAPPIAAEAQDLVNVGFVLYTKSDEPGTLNARWNYANAYSGPGEATGGPKEGYAGRYHVRYFFENGDFSDEYDLVIEKTGDFYNVLWITGGKVSARGVGMEVENGLAVGWTKVAN